MTRHPTRPASSLSPAQLGTAPELGFFDVLDAVLDVTFCALVAADPALHDPERPYWLREPLPTTHQAACRILTLMAELQRQMARYRALVQSEPDQPIHDDTIDF